MKKRFVVNESAYGKNNSRKIKQRTDLTNENTRDIVKEIIQEEKKNVGSKFLIQAAKIQKIKL